MTKEEKEVFEKKRAERVAEVQKHVDAGDLAQYISDLMDQAHAGKAELSWLTWGLFKKETLKECVIPAYKERIEKHRSAGDLKNYFFNVFFRDEIMADNFYDNEDFSHSESVVFVRENVERFLTSKEIKELKMVAQVARCLRVHRCIPDCDRGLYKYICKLFKAPKDSKDYELYTEIREITESNERIEFDSQVKKQKLMSLVVPAIAVVVLILLGVFFVITM